MEQFYFSDLRLTAKKISRKFIFKPPTLFNITPQSNISLKLMIKNDFEVKNYKMTAKIEENSVAPTTKVVTTKRVGFFKETSKKNIFCAFKTSAIWRIIGCKFCV